MAEREAGQVLEITVRRDGPKAVVRLVGELDFHESKQLRAVLDGLLADLVAAVAVDATGLTFIDSAGVNVLLTGRAGAVERGIDFGITAVSPTIRRVLEIAGATDLLPD